MYVKSEPKILIYLFMLITLFLVSCESEAELKIDHSKHNFKILSPQDGAQISESIIQASGSHNYPTDVSIWIVLEDKIGNYYLQNPTVRFKSDSTWYAKNIRPGHDITQINAVFVNNSGNKKFEEMVEEAQWGAFTKLPKGSKILATTSITTLR